MTYSPRPNPSGDTLVSSRDPIRTNFQTIQARFDENHVDIGSGAGGGNHKFLVMPEQAAAPTVVANQGAFYTKNDGTVTQFYQESEGGLEYQQTRFIDAQHPNKFGGNDNYLASHTGGWTFLPGGLIMMYGRFDTGGGTTVTYPFAFPSTNNPYSLTVTPEGTNTNTRVQINNITDSQFEFSFSDAFTALHFVAIGE